VLPVSSSSSFAQYMMFLLNAIAIAVMLGSMTVSLCVRDDAKVAPSLEIADSINASSIDSPASTSNLSNTSSLSAKALAVSAYGTSSLTQLHHKDTSINTSAQGAKSSTRSFSALSHDSKKIAADTIETDIPGGLGGGEIFEKIGLTSENFDAIKGGECLVDGEAAGYGCNLPGIGCSCQWFRSCNIGQANDPIKRTTCLATPHTDDCKITLVGQCGIAMWVWIGGGVLIVLLTIVGCMACKSIKK